jgi:peroxiredoxin Q/BCP
MAKKAKTKTTTKSATTAKKVAAKKSSGTVNYGLKVGDRAPAFVIEATSGQKIDSLSLKGKKVVLYFYPKDNTPGCTLEGQDFARLMPKFKKAGCEVFGISRDSVKSHEGFKAKYGFVFDLLSDAEGAVCKAFDVIQMKSLYGRKFEGIERSTFVIDQSGVVRGEWRKVKVNGHADEVLAFVENLG